MDSGGGWHLDLDFASCDALLAEPDHTAAKRCVAPENTSLPHTQTVHCKPPRPITATWDPIQIQLVLTANLPDRSLPP